MRFIKSLLAPAALALSVAGLAFPAAAQQQPAGKEAKLLNVSYDPTRELYEEVNRLFAQQYKAAAGVDVKVEQSHGGSSKQARSVIDGLKADVVTLALGHDVDAIQKAGLIQPGWAAEFPNNSSPYTSTIVFVVRKGNPKGVRTWDDLVKPGVGIIPANPKTSGAARWTFLAAWGHAVKARSYDLTKPEELKASADAAKAAKDFPALADPRGKAFVQALYKNAPVLDTGARGATVTFAQKNVGDVLLNWENEAYLVLEEFGKDKFDIVYPPASILAEPQVAVVDKVVDAKGTRKAAEAYLTFLYGKEAQDVAGQLHYRPRDTAVLAKYASSLPAIKLFTIDETFGGWAKAHDAFFKDGGVFDQIYAPAK